MEVGDLGVLLAFVAGVLSFVSPCHLPLVPVYVGYISGSAPQGRGATLAHALLLVLGFSVVLVLLGASVGLVGYLLWEHMRLIRRVGGIVLIVLGLHLAGIVRIPFLYREVRFEMSRPARLGYPMSFLLGIIFGVGWTPCVGPILAGILLLASTTQTVGQGAFLLAVYSLGLGLPFLLTALSLGSASGVVKRLNRYGNAVSAASGVLLILMGMLIYTNRLQQLAALFNWVPPL